MAQIKNWINKKVPQLIEKIGYYINPIILKFINENNHLAVFYFHGIYKDEEQRNLNHVDPQNNVTVSEFIEFIEYIKKHKYLFVSPNNLLEGLKKGHRYAMITFDDGYFNNSQIIEVINNYKIPIVIFVSTDYVVNNKSYWWDVIYKYRIKQGINIPAIKREQSQLKKFKFEYIEDYIVKNFGLQAQIPWSDIDRPLSLPELMELSKNDLVTIGNHTHNHSLLINYEKEEISSELEAANKIIKDSTGSFPITMAFPNGYFNPEILNITEKIGFKFAFTTEQKKNNIFFPAKFNCLNRFLVVRSDIKRYGTFYRLGYHPVSLFLEIKRILLFKQKSP